MLANKRKDAVVVVDEAYIHFSDNAQSAADLVAAGKDVDRAADLLEDLWHGRPARRLRHGPAGPAGQAASVRRQGFLPVTGLACATASLQGEKPGGRAARASSSRSAKTPSSILEKKGI